MWAIHKVTGLIKFFQVFCANESLCLKVTAKSIARIVSICGGTYSYSYLQLKRMDKYT